MKETTLCYIERDGAYLMMHRVKKEKDINRDKWIGVGGKIEDGETPFDCARREIKEETGATAKHLKYRGIITFVSDIYGTEIMHLFTTDCLLGDINYDSDEGNLEWVRKQDIPHLPIWEGDKIFFKLLDTENRFFRLTLNYNGDNLISHELSF